MSEKSEQQPDETPAEQPVDPFKAALEAKRAKSNRSGSAHADAQGKSVKSGPDAARRMRQRRMGGS